MAIDLFSLEHENLVNEQGNQNFDPLLFADIDNAFSSGIKYQCQQLSSDTL